MISPFSSLLQGLEKDFVIAQSDFFIAVLEKKPLVLGHVVVVSKTAEDAIFDLSNQALSNLMPFCRPIARSIQQMVPCVKVGVAVLGLQTRHAHLHLVPVSSAEDLNFAREKLTVSDDELRRMAFNIRTAYEDLPL
jgi:histidine triad (HIT) family protein